MTDSVKEQTPTPTDTQEPEVPAQETKPSPRLPKGVTEQQVDEWKARYKKIGLIRVGGKAIVVRPITQREVMHIRQEFPTNEAWVREIVKLGMLFCEVGTRPAGFIAGVSKSLAQISNTGDGELFAVDDLRETWERIMTDYPEEDRISLAYIENFEGDLWVLLTGDRPYLFTSLDAATFDRVHKENPEEINDGIIAASLVYPSIPASVIQDCPYGLYDQLLAAARTASGFEVETATIL